MFSVIVKVCRCLHKGMLFIYCMYILRLNEIGFVITPLKLPHRAAGDYNGATVVLTKLAVGRRLPERSTGTSLVDCSPSKIRKRHYYNAVACTYYIEIFEFRNRER